jgi:UDP-N-acetylglucosamine 2-epimerase
MVTGNTVIDALLWTVKQRVPYGDPALDAIDSTDAPLLLVTTHRRESWGERIRDVASAVAELARKHPDLIVVLPLHPNPVVREALMPALHGMDNVMLVEPMGYGAFARLLQRSTVVLTDSGGVQEEAPSLGKPVLVMRDTTERPEAVSVGTARLVGTDPDRVCSEVNQLLTCRGPIRRWPMPSTPTATAAPRSGRQKPSSTCSALVIGQFPLAAAPPPENDPLGASPAGLTVQLRLPFAPKPETGGPRQLPAGFDLATWTPTAAWPIGQDQGSGSGGASVFPWIVTISSAPRISSTLASARCGRSSTRSPPRCRNLLAATKRTRMAAVSAKSSPATSTVSCCVSSASWPVISSLRSAAVVMSTSPDSVITGPDSPADTDARSVLTAHS